MLLSVPLASLTRTGIINIHVYFGSLIRKKIFRMSLIKFYHNSQRISDSFYHISKSNEFKIKENNKCPKHTYVGSAMFQNL